MEAPQSLSGRWNYAGAGGGAQQRLQPLVFAPHRSWTLTERALPPARLSHNSQGRQANVGQDQRAVARLEINAAPESGRTGRDQRLSLDWPAPVLPALIGPPDRLAREFGPRPRVVIVAVVVVSPALVLGRRMEELAP